MLLAKLLAFAAASVITLAPSHALAQTRQEYLVQAGDRNIEEAVARWASYSGKVIAWRCKQCPEATMALSDDGRARINAVLASAKPNDLDSALERTLTILNSERTRLSAPRSRMRLYIFAIGRYRAVFADEDISSLTS